MKKKDTKDDEIKLRKPKRENKPKEHLRVKSKVINFLLGIIIFDSIFNDKSLLSDKFFNRSKMF